MARPARKLATYDDLLGMEERIRAEVLGGEVAVSPSARAGHGRSARVLAARLGGAFDPDDDDPAGWWIIPDVDVRLGAHDIIRPDISGWRRARMPELSDALPIDLVPDWVCEVLSPSNAHVDRGPKLSLYGRSGVPHAWLADPTERTLEAFANEGGRWVLLGVWTDGDRVRIPPFEALELDVGTVFTPRRKAHIEEPGER